MKDAEKYLFLMKQTQL